MKLKALTILQPWAGFILCGGKTVENRTWKTLYRGPLLIHSGQDRRGLDRTVSDHWFHLGGIIRHDAQGRPEFQTGAVLGIVNVVDVRLAEGRPPTSWHDPGTARSTATSPAPSRRSYWWELSDAVLFDKPIAQRGQLMLFGIEVPDDTPLQSDKWPTLKVYVERLPK